MFIRHFIVSSSIGDERHEVGVCESATGMLIVGCEWCWLIARVSECQDSCDRVSGLWRTTTTTDAGSHCTGPTYIMHDDLVLVSTSTYDTGVVYHVV